jgi:hypothetical protein
VLGEVRAPLMRVCAAALMPTVLSVTRRWSATFRPASAAAGPAAARPRGLPIRSLSNACPGSLRSAGRLGDGRDAARPTAKSFAVV